MAESGFDLLGLLAQIDALHVTSLRPAGTAASSTTSRR
jgi:hypothetical protein